MGDLKLSDSKDTRRKIYDEVRELVRDQLDADSASTLILPSSRNTFLMTMKKSGISVTVKIKSLRNLQKTKTRLHPEAKRILACSVWDGARSGELLKTAFTIWE